MEPVKGLTHFILCLPSPESPPWEYTRSAGSYLWVRLQMIFHKFAEQKGLNYKQCRMRWVIELKAFDLGY